MFMSLTTIPDLMVALDHIFSEGADGVDYQDEDGYSSVSFNDWMSMNTGYFSGNITPQLLEIFKDVYNSGIESVEYDENHGFKSTSSFQDWWDKNKTSVILTIEGEIID